MSDLIDRQVAIDDIWTVSPLAPLDREWIDRWLRQLPPAQPAPSQVAKDIARIVENGQDMRVIAQPERIKGHWVKISPANIYECSECGKSVMTNDICAYDFCHGCGADMREVTK